MIKSTQWKKIFIELKNDYAVLFSELLEDENNPLNPYYPRFKTFQFDFERDGNKFELSLSRYGLVEVKNSSLDQAIEIVRKRVDEVGTNEPNIVKRGNNRILVELPGLDNPDRIKDLLGKTANLTFQFVTNKDDNSFGVEILTSEETGEKLTLSKRVILSGENLIDASPRMDSLNNETVVTFTLDRVGSKRFAKATKQGVGKRLAIVLDKKIISALLLEM